MSNVSDRISDAAGQHAVSFVENPFFYTLGLGLGLAVIGGMSMRVFLTISGLKDKAPAQKKMEFSMPGYLLPGESVVIGSVMTKRPEAAPALPAA